MPEGVYRPHQRLAVGHVQGGGVERGTERGVLARGHHGVDVAHAYVSALAMGHHRIDPPERLVVVGQRKGHADHVHGGRSLDRNGTGLDGTLGAHFSWCGFHGVGKPKQTLVSKPARALAMRLRGAWWLDEGTPSSTNVGDRQRLRCWVASWANRLLFPLNSSLSRTPQRYAVGLDKEIERAREHRPLSRGSRTAPSPTRVVL